MIVNYEGKEIETYDVFWNLSGAIYDYKAAHGTDKKGTGYVLLWQKVPDEDADNGYTVSEKPSYVVKDYRYSFSGTFNSGEEWSERAEGFFDFCDELKRISNNPRVFPEKIVITGDHPFSDASEEEILEEILWNCGYEDDIWSHDYSIDFGNDETVITFNQN
jgi:hypothetical protein